MRYLYLVVGLFCIVASKAQLDDAISTFVKSNALQHAQLGFSLIDIETGNEIAAYNSHQFFYGASLQKLITTNQALLVCGEDYRYTTRIYYSDSVLNGTLYGNLIIDASGDPTLNAKAFDNDVLKKTITALHNKGIDRIKGSVILKHKEDITVPQTWLYEDVGNYYAAIPLLFNYKDNSYAISLKSGMHNSTPQVKKIVPQVPYTFSYLLKSDKEVYRDEAYILGTPFSSARQIVGSIPIHKENFILKGANAHPLYSFIQDLSKKITIDGLEQNLSSDKVLLTIESVSLNHIARYCNAESDNFLAEALLKTIGKEIANSFATNSGILAIENALSTLDINFKEVTIKDGSGLSRLNAMTPHFMSDYLCQNFNHKAFVNSLAIAGKSGTMRYLNDEKLKGRIRGKSGSAEGVVNYTGYIDAYNGKRYAFTIMINQAYSSKPNIRKTINKLLTTVLTIEDF